MGTPPKMKIKQSEKYILEAIDYHHLRHLCRSRLVFILSTKKNPRKKMFFFEI